MGQLSRGADPFLFLLTWTVPLGIRVHACGQRSTCHRNCFLPSDAHTGHTVPPSSTAAWLCMGLAAVPGGGGRPDEDTGAACAPCWRRHPIAGVIIAVLVPESMAATRADRPDDPSGRDKALFAVFLSLALVP